MTKIKVEKHYRSLIKAISYRFINTSVTILIVYIFTGKLALSFGVGAVEIISKMIIYYFHERVWNYITFGQWRHPLSEFEIKGDLRENDKEVISKKLRDMGYLD